MTQEAYKASSKGSLEYRAAQYFGVQNKPRTSIKLGRWSCLIVLDRTEYQLLWYDEELQRRGAVINLTPSRKAALIEALGGEVPNGTGWEIYA